MQNCVSYPSGEHIFGKFIKTTKKSSWKVKHDAERALMAGVMGIWGGLMGPKIENVGFSLVLPLLLKGQRRPEDARSMKCIPSRGGFEVQKCDLWLNMLCIYIQKCVSHCSGEHIFTKIMKTCHRKMKNVAQVMSDTSKHHHNGVGCIKMSLKLCRIHY